MPIPILEEAQLDKLDEWLRSVLWDSKLPNMRSAADSGIPAESGVEIHRLKARIPLRNGGVKVVQGVREIFEILDGKEEDKAAAPLGGKIVLIGRHIANLPFQESFNNTVRLT